ncbi:MAG: Protein-disulfide isomerase [uncultured bacterium (gcode 4)]|uniref:Protein-disulfide isomerase n=1 Tax=uncultured bacterium (gcode 4) TaxID=1234023 RepID=K2G1W9_9BACT|nr:MAG: Protein-disulfide isomerase [uncultured bacterium (gcode 4)]
MQTNDKKHLPIIIITLLCSALIITFNYFMTKQIVFDLQQKINENEYEKIWWKDNYNILKEMQKEEILSYVNKLKTENPELIYKMRQNATVKESPEKKLLTWKAIWELEWNSYVEWSSGATVTIMEFSDFECSFCKDFHNEDMLKQYVAKSKDTNYIFKNFPLPVHKYAVQMANYAKCAEKIDWGKRYMDAVDKLFMLEPLSESWSSLQKIRQTVLKTWVDEKALDECVNNKENEMLVKKEFEQWMKLWIASTPTIVFINNLNWEYTTLVWAITEEQISSTIDSITNE